MNIEKAVRLRFKKLLTSNNLTINGLSNKSGVSPSTFRDFMNNKTHSLGIVTLKKLCDGLNISIIDFFDNELFKNLEQEIN